MNAQAEAWFDTIRRGASHAYLLIGEREIVSPIVKQGVAILLCEEPEKAPCGECEACLWRLAESHPDFLHVEADRQKVNPVIRIDQIRSLQDEAARSPQKHRRIVWIEEANCMRSEAQNALLKMLEEPPENLVFLLSGQEAGVLPTVRSRCSVLRFGGMQEQEIVLGNIEEAGAVLKALYRGETVRAQQLMTAEKGNFRKLLPVMILLLREAIAEKLDLLALNEAVRQWVKWNPSPWSFNMENELLTTCMEQEKRLKGNASANLCIDALCIEARRIYMQKGQ